MTDSPIGNLKAAYPGAIDGWEGCYDKDCLPNCDLRKSHCERLKLFLDMACEVSQKEEIDGRRENDLN